MTLLSNIPLNLAFERLAKIDILFSKLDVLVIKSELMIFLRQMNETKIIGLSTTNGLNKILVEIIKIFIVKFQIALFISQMNFVFLF